MKMTYRDFKIKVIITTVSFILGLCLVKFFLWYIGINSDSSGAIDISYVLLVFAALVIWQFKPIKSTEEIQIEEDYSHHIIDDEK